MKIRKLYLPVAFAVMTALGMSSAQALEPSELNDLQIAHVAYTADVIDIRYAYLALALSENQEIHKFARTMIRDHTAVNEQALGLLDKLGAKAQNNPLSHQLVEGSKKLID